MVERISTRLRRYFWGAYASPRVVLGVPPSTLRTSLSSVVRSFQPEGGSVADRGLGGCLHRPASLVDEVIDLSLTSPRLNYGLFGGAVCGRICGGRSTRLLWALHVSRSLLEE